MFDLIDIRLKTLLCLGLVILAFAAGGWWSLAVVALACVGLLTLSGLPAERFIKGWWSLRWLLLFTVLMHLLFSPGRMMFGSRWLSYDGLLQGLFVSTQVSVAIFAAMLLSLTTPVEKMAAAIGWFLAPLKRVGCPVDAWQTQFQLVLHFIPKVRASFAADPDADPGMAGSFRSQGWSHLETRLTGMLDRLIEDADQMAHQIATGQEPVAAVTAWSPLRPFHGIEGRVTILAAVVIMIYWVV